MTTDTSNDAPNNTNKVNEPLLLEEEDILKEEELYLLQQEADDNKPANNNKCKLPRKRTFSSASDPLFGGDINRKRLFSIDYLDDPVGHLEELEENVVNTTATVPSTTNSSAAMSIPQLVSSSAKQAMNRDRSDSLVATFFNHKEGSSSSKQQRDRGLSMDFFSFKMDDIPSATLSTNSAVISSDEVTEHDSHASDSVAFNAKTVRPRGESIIFDPMSFQDGGIHEAKALEKRARAGSYFKEDSDDLMNSLGIVVEEIQSQYAVSTNAGSSSSANDPLPVTSTSSAQSSATTVPLPSAMASKSDSRKSGSSSFYTNHVSFATNNNNIQNPVTMINGMEVHLDLVNKGGRIGIYLPEQRKARIAKFHSKRKNRIWRKRIKYDCRKKLADSRPRIKGRFVKRSDMEDEVANATVAATLHAHPFK